MSSLTKSDCRTSGSDTGRARKTEVDISSKQRQATKRICGENLQTPDIETAKLKTSGYLHNIFVQWYPPQLTPVIPNFLLEFPRFRTSGTTSSIIYRSYSTCRRARSAGCAERLKKLSESTLSTQKSWNLLDSKSGKSAWIMPWSSYW